MAGPVDRINSALTGHTTSGLDQAMQDHADKLHPVGPSDTKITRSADPIPKYKSAVAPPGGYALKLPGDAP